MTTYLEIDSTYRDRSRFPLPGQFEIPVAQSGAKNQVTALDPVSDAAPIKAWSGHQFDANTDNTPSVDVTPFSASSGYSTRTELILEATPHGQLQQEDGYYNKAIVYFDFPTATPSLDVGIRIEDYKFLGNYFSTIEKCVVIINQSVDYNYATRIRFRSQTLRDATNPLYFVPNGSDKEGSYIGYYLYNEDQNEYRVIDAYYIFNRTVSVDTETGGETPEATWSANTNYCIRKELPETISAIDAGSTTTSIIFTSGSTDDDFYTNQYLRIRALVYGNGVIAPETEIRKIIAFNGTTRTATVHPAFSATPVAGSVIETLPFSRDNVNPYSSIMSNNVQGCYTISLVNLTLPNKVLQVGEGNRIAFYPYMYVELNTMESSSMHALTSNNPNSTMMMFRVPVTDTSNPSSSTFLTLGGGGMTQTVFLTPSTNLKFSVRLSSGEIYTLVDSDRFSPFPPDPAVQISCMFKLEKKN